MRTNLILFVITIIALYIAIKNRDFSRVMLFIAMITTFANSIIFLIHDLTDSI